MAIKGLHKLEVTRWKFPAGESGFRVADERAAYADFFNIKFDYADDSSLFELALVVDALRGIKDVPIHLQMPYVPYARQDRRAVSGESHSLRVLAHFINSLNFKTVTVVDPHSDVVEAVFDRLVITPQEKAIPLNILFSQQIDFLVAPDAGASKKIYKAANWVGKPVLIANKVRDPRTGEIKGLKFDSEDLSAIKPTDKLLVVDDICDGGRTFIEVAKALPVAKEQLSLYTTHGIYSKGIEVLQEFYSDVSCYNDIRDISKENSIRVEMFI